ncbi:NlpC/P60 family protein [Clostridium cibarium]|uniref:C40 family peptidase n=1 Tax=Clostridium cibarium TaxID=2762247 RepID=A0ABR8PQ13_9CLOT|nr:NlpC/P60 family protein [Clostridium cibarium]MBD7910261.1 C40 family peptidase [Clostridium cibarium]
MKVKKLMATVLLLGMVQTLLPSVDAKAAIVDEMKWKIHTATSMEEIGNSKWQFLIGDYNRDGREDLYCIRKDAGNHTSVHILDGYSNYKENMLHKELPIEATGDNWTFVLGDYNGDGIKDLYCVRKDSGEHTNVHILDGSTNFQTYIVSNILPIENTDENWDFKAGDYDGDGKDDLYCIKKNGGEHTTLHILSAKSDFHEFLCRVPLPIENTGKNWEFGVSDYNGDKKPDFYGIRKDGGATTNVHVMNGSDNYQSFLLQTTTIAGATDDKTDFMVGKGRFNIYFVNKNGTGSGKTELHMFGLDELVPTTPTETSEQKVINEAMKHLGKPYVYNTTGPDTFDCSGFTSYVYRHALGIEIGRDTYAQVNSGREVSQSELKPGDLVFPKKDHVGIYIGNGKMIHAPHPGDVVKIANVYAFWKARRIIG